MSELQRLNGNSSFRDCCKRVRELLRKEIIFDDDPYLRFAPTHKPADILDPAVLRDLFTCLSQTNHGSLDVDNTVDVIVQKELHTVIAVMVYADIEEQGFRSFIGHIVTLPIHGKDLPWSANQVMEVFKDQDTVGKFMDHQFTFCALVLTEKKEIHCDPRVRFPYVSQPKELGEGSFGKVFSVRIAVGHVRIGEAGAAPYETERDLARKDYQIESGAWQETERKVMSAIVTNRSRHDNILENFCSVTIGSTYSLFMDLAYCDLKVFMEEKRPAAPSNIREKADIMYQAAGLASGLHFLHCGLKSEAFEQLSCFHMDLKPKNILIVYKNGQSRWVLSDFNMSKVKAKAKSPSEAGYRQPADEHDSTDFNHFFRRRGGHGTNSTVDGTASTVNPARDGTYLSPEACECIPDRKTVRTESDTWSLGCVLSVVFSYIVGGADAVRTFRERRSHNRDNDQFFSLKRHGHEHIPSFSFLRSRQSKEANRVKEADQVNEAIRPWFENLVQQTRQLSDRESQALDTVLRFLLDKVLIINPDKRRRTTAEHVERKLGSTGETYRRLNTISPTRPPASSHYPTSNGTISRGFASSHDKYQVDNDMNGADQCRIAPNGRTVFYLIAGSIKAYSLVALCEARNSQRSVVLGSDDIGTSNTHLQNMVVSNHHAVFLAQQFQSQVVASLFV